MPTAHDLTMHAYGSRFNICLISGIFSFEWFTGEEINLMM